MMQPIFVFRHIIEREVISFFTKTFQKLFTLFFAVQYALFCELANTIRKENLLDNVSYSFLGGVGGMPTRVAARFDGRFESICQPSVDDSHQTKKWFDHCEDRPQ